MGEGDIVGLDNSGFIGNNEPYAVELFKVAYGVLEITVVASVGIVVVVKTVGTRALSVTCHTESDRVVDQLLRADVIGPLAVVGTRRESHSDDEGNHQCEIIFVSGQRFHSVMSMSFNLTIQSLTTMWVFSQVAPLPSLSPPVRKNSIDHSLSRSRNSWAGILA